MSDKITPVKQAVARGCEAPSDDRARRIVFRRVLGAAILAIAAAHLIQARLSYRIGADQALIKHGSFGFSLARYSPAESPRKTAVLLGNSVYQFQGIVPRMQKMADEGHLNLTLINMAQTGTGVNDYLVQAAKVLAQPPDLLVVVLMPPTFDRALPDFRTDANLMALDPGAVARLPVSFYISVFDHQAFADAAFAAVAPYPRLDPLLRTLWKPGFVPGWALQRLRFPSLNLTADWAAASGSRPHGFPSGKSYEGAEARLRELVAMTRKAGVPLLFIWQEYQKGAEPDWRPDLQSLAAANPGWVIVADLQDFWRQEDYVDAVHPKEEGWDAYAARHFQAIRAALTSAKAGSVAF